MAHFLFQSDPIDDIHFNPIKIDIHQGVIKIMDDEIFYDFQLILHFWALQIEHYWSCYYSGELQSKDTVCQGVSKL